MLFSCYKSFYPSIAQEQYDWFHDGDIPFIRLQTFTPGILVLFPEWFGCSANESSDLTLMIFPGINIDGFGNIGTEAAALR